MIITICASLKSYITVLKIKTELEKSGHFVYYPWAVEEINKGNLNPANLVGFKLKNQSKAIKVHYEKIKKSDAILVINETKNNIDNYIGGNTLIEIGFAYVLNKKIFLLNPIPKVSYEEEISAMNPKILNGKLKNMKN